MGLQTNPAGRSRLGRGLLAVAFAVVAVLAFRSGRRKTGLLAGLGALGVGVTAGGSDRGGIDTDSEVSAGGDHGQSERSGATRSNDGSPGDARTVHGSASIGQQSLTRGSLTCASCGEPITLGEPRGPNDRDEIVHERCR